LVLDPTGVSLGEALCRDEGILYADIDLARSVEPKQFHDLVGSYNRFDIFTLTVDRSARPPARFIEEGLDSAGAKTALDGSFTGQNPRVGSKPQGPVRKRGARAAQTEDSLRAGQPPSHSMGPGEAPGGLDIAQPHRLAQAG
jgi:hypothetical protein